MFRKIDLCFTYIKEQCIRYYFPYVLLTFKIYFRFLVHNISFSSCRHIWYQCNRKSLELWFNCSSFSLFNWFDHIRWLRHTDILSCNKWTYLISKNKHSYIEISCLKYLVWNVHVNAFDRIFCKWSFISMMTTGEL